LRRGGQVQPSREQCQKHGRNYNEAYFRGPQFHGLSHGHERKTHLPTRGLACPVVIGDMVISGGSGVTPPLVHKLAGLSFAWRNLSAVT